MILNHLLSKLLDLRILRLLLCKFTQFDFRLIASDHALCEKLINFLVLSGSPARAAEVRGVLSTSLARTLTLRGIAAATLRRAARFIAAILRRLDLTT